MGKAWLLVIDDESYQDSLFGFIKKMGRDSCCFVSINKGYSALVGLFKKYRIVRRGFTFVDCVTASVTNVKDSKDCIYISSPNHLTDLSIVLRKMIGDYNAILIDSLSNLMMYHDANTVAHFIHDLVTKINADGSDLILVVSNRDLKTPICKNVSTMVDEVIKI